MVLLRLFIPGMLAGPQFGNVRSWIPIRSAGYELFPREMAGIGVFQARRTDMHSEMHVMPWTKTCPGVP